MNINLFTSREAEARAILTSTQKHRGTLITGSSDIGKTALLEFITPVLETTALTIHLERINPFGSFLRDLHTALWDAKAVDGIEFA